MGWVLRSRTTQLNARKWEKLNEAKFHQKVGAVNREERVGGCGRVRPGSTGTVGAESAGGWGRGIISGAPASLGAVTPGPSAPALPLSLELLPNSHLHLRPLWRRPLNPGSNINSLQPKPCRQMMSHLYNIIPLLPLASRNSCGRTLPFPES